MTILLGLELLINKFSKS